MPKPIDPKDKEAMKDGETSAADESMNGLNSPELDEQSGKPKNRAVSSFKQAHAICKRQYDRAEETRLKSAAVVSDKYGGSPPYKQGVLSNSGQGWRSNFTTNPLASVVDRATPQIKDPIKQADSLTYSSLPAIRKDANVKTRKFRKRMTKLFRSWSAWDDFIDCVTQDNYLFGNACPGWIDDDWRPKAFRHNESFLPEGTGQHASQAQFIVYRQPILLHEFLKKIEDKEVAEAAGYNWEGCIKAANESAGLRGGESTHSAFEQVDALREGGGLEKTYEGDTKIVWLFHLLVREYDGGVNLWTTTQKGGHAVRAVEDLHEGMEDAACFFTLQAGNNRFYGSKGSGRMLTNVHIAIDRKRNFDQDKAYVAGLPIWKVKGKDPNTVQMHFRAPFMFITGDAEMEQEMVMFDYAAADFQDKKMTQLMEEIAGAFIPPKLQESGTPNTKIAAAEKAQRELAVRLGVLGRFFRQFGDLISAMQRKVCRPDNLKEAQRIFEESKKKEQTGIRIITAKLWKWLKGVIKDFDKQAAPMGETKSADSEAVEAIVDLLQDGLSIEEIAELALSPAANSTVEQPDVQDDKVTGLIAGVTQNPALGPYFDHAKMAAKVAKIQGGDDVAEELLLKGKPDPNDQAINTREELSEWMTMMQGDPVGAAQTDNHRVRRLVLATKLMPILQMLEQAPTAAMVKLASMAVPHYGQHLAMDKETPEELLQGEIESFHKMEQIIMDADKALQKLADEAVKAGATGPDGMPPPMPGGAAPPPGMNAGDKESELERAKLHAETERTAADTLMKTKQIEVEHRKLDIKEKEMSLHDQHHTDDTMMTQAASVAKQAADAGMAGEAAAREDLAKQNEIERAAQGEYPPSSI